jgi:hypothetical protein
MRYFLNNLLLVTVFFFFSGFCASTAFASNEQPAPSDFPVVPAVTGQHLEEEIAGAVGISLSPILGLGVTGAWKWFVTPEMKRDSLPISQQPIFWGPMLLILAGIILKDGMKIFGPVPKPLFVPADALEEVVNKGGGLVGLAVIVGGILSGGAPEMVAAVQSTGEALGGILLPAAAQAANAAVRGGGASVLWTGLTGVIAGFCYVVVWLVSHSVNVLILISPFAIIDFFLKMLRLSLLGLLVGAMELSPWLGGAMALAIVVVAWIVAGRAFRLMVFGTILGWDLLFRREVRIIPVEGDEIYGFAGRGLKEVPAMSFGRLCRAQRNGRDELQFRWRPWLFLPSRTVVLPVSLQECAVGIGSFSPVLMKTLSDDAAGPVSAGDLFFRLRPQYRGAEVRVARVLGIDEVEDVGCGRGVKALWRWLKNLWQDWRVEPSEY